MSRRGLGEEGNAHSTSNELWAEEEGPISLPEDTAVVLRVPSDSSSSNHLIKM